MNCPYCGEPMKLGDGCYWCMNKRCAEQFYPSGNDDLARKERCCPKHNIPLVCYCPACRGEATSAAKRKASVQNGKKGGRPKGIRG